MAWLRAAWARLRRRPPVPPAFEQQVSSELHCGLDILEPAPDGLDRIRARTRR